MNHLTDDQILIKLEHAVSCEKKNTARVVAYLSELEKRKLYLKRSYSSLYVFAREVLKYSSSSSYRRVSAAYLSLEFPETIDAIATGQLTLCAAAELWSSFENTRKIKQTQKENNTKETEPNKKDLFDSVLGKTTEEARREIRNFEIKTHGQEQTRKKKRGKLIPVSKTITELRAEMETETLVKFQKLQSLLSHKIPDGDPTKLLEYLIELGLEKHDPILKEERIQKRKNKNSHVEVQNEYKATPASTVNNSTVNFILKPRPAISQPLQRKVKTSHEYGCRYIDEKTGKTCGSTWRLSMDHIHPYSKGGAHTEENLQLLCGRHNVWKSDRVFEKMKSMPN